MTPKRRRILLWSGTALLAISLVIQIFLPSRPIAAGTSVEKALFIFSVAAFIVGMGFDAAVLVMALRPGKQ